MDPDDEIPSESFPSQFNEFDASMIESFSTISIWNLND